MNGGCHSLVFSEQAVAVSVPGPASFDIVLAFLLTGVLLGVLQLLEQRQI